MATRNDSPDPRHHTSGCLERGVDAWCDDKPDPGCTCGRPGGTVPDVDDAEYAYPPCPICGDPIDYCQGHGNERVLDTHVPA